MRGSVLGVSSEGLRFPHPGFCVGERNTDGGAGGGADGGDGDDSCR